MSFIEPIVKKQSVIESSVKSKPNINGFTESLSTKLPLKGDSITPGMRCIAVTVAIIVAFAPYSTSIEYIATFENHAPKYAINCTADSCRTILCC